MFRGRTIMETKVIPLQHKAHLYVATNKEINGIFVDINFKAGSINDPKNRQGLAHFCEHAIFSFPTKRFATRLEKMEYCRTNFYSNAHTSLFAMGFNFETTRENFEEHFEYICHNFDEVIATKEEVEKEKSIVCTEIKKRLKTNNWQEYVVQYKKIFDCPILKNSAIFPSGKEEDVLKITPKDVEKFIKTYITKQNLSSVSIAGNITAREAEKFVYKYLYPHLNDGEKIAPTDEEIVKSFSKAKYVYEKSAEKDNALIEIYFPSFKPQIKEDPIKSFRENQILHGYMNEEVFEFMRMQHSLTYHCGLSNGSKLNGLTFRSIFVECAQENVEKVLSLLPECIHNIKSNFTEEKFNLHKRKTYNNYNVDTKPMSSIKSLMPYNYEFYGMPYGKKYLKKVGKALKNATYEDAKKELAHFDDEQPTVLILSDKKPNFDYQKFVKLIK